MRLAPDKPQSSLLGSGRSWGISSLQITWTAPFGLEYAIVANSDCRGRISSASNTRRNFSCWVNPALFISQKVLILRDVGRCGGTLVAMMQGKNIVLKDEKGGMSMVTIPNVFQSNGVIHVVDTVVIPN